MSDLGRKLDQSRTDRLPVCSLDFWVERYSWVVAGTTERVIGDGEPNYGLFAAGATPAVLANWSRLSDELGFDRAVHSRQVHEAAVRVHDEVPAGLLLAPPGDGHATRQPGVLLTVATADCVPIFVLDPERRVAALLHGGWRGVAAGILENGVAVLTERFGSNPGDLLLHFGPAISGERYEVGPEVFEALGLDRPSGPTLLDLRAVLHDRAVALGVPASNLSVSERCTADPQSPHFSHRCGDQGRQIAFLGIVS